MDARGGLGEAIDLAASLTGCEKNETPWRRVRYNSEMPGELATLVETAPTVVEAEIPVGSARLRWFEVCLVLLITCGSNFLSSLYIFVNGPSGVSHFPGARWTMGIVQESAGLLLLGYVLFRSNRRFKDIGLSWSLRQVGSGLLVAIISYISYSIGYTLIHFLHAALFPHAAAGPTPRDLFGHASLMMVPFSLLNPFFEELIVRAYLMTEVSALTGSSVLAIILSVLVQTSYHLYYGWIGALTLSFQFLVFAIYFARTRKALPIIVAHGIFDLLALLWLR